MCLYFFFLHFCVCRHSATSWRLWSKISWRRGKHPLACWLCSRLQTSWPPACLPCILLHHKEAWQRSTWVSRREDECLWLFDLSLAMSVLAVSNAGYAQVNFWTRSSVWFQLAIQSFFSILFAKTQEWFLCLSVKRTGFLLHSVFLLAIVIILNFLPSKWPLSFCTYLFPSQVWVWWLRWMICEAQTLFHMRRARSSFAANLLPFTGSLTCSAGLSSSTTTSQ